MRVRGNLARGAAVLLIASVGFGMLGMDGQNSGPLVTPGGAPLKPILIPDEAVPPDEGWTWNRWKCQLFADGCPNGIKRDESKNFVGCVFKATDGTCSGKCTVCVGSPTPVSVCVPVEENVYCAVAGVAPPVACGEEWEFTKCKFSSTQPPGEPIKTPNNCYCDGVFRRATGGGTCYVQPCS